MAFYYAPFVNPCDLGEEELIEMVVERVKQVLEAHIDWMEKDYCKYLVNNIMESNRNCLGSDLLNKIRNRLFKFI